MKISIIPNDGLRNAVLATAILKPLKKIFVKAEMGICVKTHLASLFEDQSYIAKTHVCDFDWGKNKLTKENSWPRIIKFFKELKEIRYDMVINLNLDWRINLFCWLAGIKKRFGIASGNTFFLQKKYTPPQTGLPQQINFQSMLFDWFNIFIHQEFFSPRIELALHEIKTGRDFVKKRGWQGKTIAILQTPLNFHKNAWAPRDWVELIKESIDSNSNMRWIIICPSAQQIKYKNELSFISQQKIWLTGLNLSEIKSLIYQSEVFFGSDSGLTQMGHALGKTVVTFYQLQDSKFIAPLWPHNHHFIDLGQPREKIVQNVNGFLAALENKPSVKN